jgi:hypothetical protein
MVGIPAEDEKAEGRTIPILAATASDVFVPVGNGRETKRGWSCDQPRFVDG